MPKLVCSECSIEMKPTRIGVLVIFMAGADPYQTASGDEKSCPNCMKSAIDGWGDSAYQHDDGFHDAILQALTMEPTKVRISWERLAHRRSLEDGLIHLQNYYEDRFREE